MSLKQPFCLILREEREVAQMAAVNWGGGANRREYWLEGYCGQLDLDGVHLIWVNKTVCDLEEIEKTYELSTLARSKNKSGY